jgi:lysophospholipase L1-like esterase
VLNAGIPNSGPSDQALWYDRWVSRFHPEMVILMVYGGNDVSDEVHDSKFTLAPDHSAVPLDLLALEKNGGLEARLQEAVLHIPGYDFLTQHSQLLYAVRSALTTLFSSRDGKRSNAEARDSTAKVAIEKIIAEVRWLRHRVEISGAKLVVVFAPPRDELVEESWKSPEMVLTKRLEDRLGEEMPRDGIPYLDLTPILVSKSRSQPASLYFRHDDHMRPVGYRLIAEAIARLLLNRG